GAGEFDGAGIAGGEVAEVIEGLDGDADRAAGGGGRGGSDGKIIGAGSGHRDVATGAGERTSRGGDGVGTCCPEVRQEKGKATVVETARDRKVALWISRANRRRDAGWPAIAGDGIAKLVGGLSGDNKRVVRDDRIASHDSHRIFAEGPCGDANGAGG